MLNVKVKLEDTKYALIYIKKIKICKYMQNFLEYFKV